MTIEEQLAIAKEVLEKCEAATPGPWKMRDSFFIACDECSEESDVFCVECGDSAEYPTANVQSFGLESFAGPNAESITALHNHAPAILEGWVRAVEHCKQAQLLMAYNARTAGERDAYKHILALLTMPKEPTDER